MKKEGSENIKKMKLDDYEIGRTLGKGKPLGNSGGFGKVKIAKNKKTGKYFALKLLNKGDIIKSQQVDHVYNENFVHSQINHPFIVHFEGLAQDSKYLYLVLELINGGELFTYLRSVETFPTEQARYHQPFIKVLCGYCGLFFRISP
jgi:serine/threonine protein kinase